MTPISLRNGVGSTPPAHTITASFLMITGLSASLIETLLLLGTYDTMHVVNTLSRYAAFSFFKWS